MRKTLAVIACGVVALAVLAAGLLTNGIAWSCREIVMAGIAVVLVGLAVHF